MKWSVSVNTDAVSPQDIWAVGEEKLLEDQYGFLVGPRSVVVLIGKHEDETLDKKEEKKMTVKKNKETLKKGTKAVSPVKNARTGKSGGGK